MHIAFKIKISKVFLEFKKIYKCMYSAESNCRDSITDVTVTFFTGICHWNDLIKNINKTLFWIYAIVVNKVNFMFYNIIDFYIISRVVRKSL